MRIDWQNSHPASSNFEFRSIYTSFYSQEPALETSPSHLHDPEWSWHWVPGSGLVHHTSSQLLISATQLFSHPLESSVVTGLSGRAGSFDSIIRCCYQVPGPLVLALSPRSIFHGGPHIMKARLVSLIVYSQRHVSKGGLEPYFILLGSTPMQTAGWLSSCISEQTWHCPGCHPTEQGQDQGAVLWLDSQQILLDA